MTTRQPAAAGIRAQWDQVPGHIHDWVGTLLGSPVTSAVNQPGGFSPGLAARVRCADGSRAFVKAVGTPLNPDTPHWHRAEARFAAALPDTAPAPRLRGSYDDGEWVALVFDEIDGHAPEMPWRTGDLEHVLQAVTELSTAVTPCPLGDAPTAADRLRQDLTAYPRLAAAPPDDLDDPQAYAERHPLLTDVDAWHVTGLLAGLAGMWAEESRQPAPAGIPTLRAFQRAQLDVTLPWIRRRTGWE